MQASYQSLLITAQEKLQQLRLKQGRLSAQMQTSAAGGSGGSHADSSGDGGGGTSTAGRDGGGIHARGGSGEAVQEAWGGGRPERSLHPWQYGAMGQLPLPTMPLR